MSQFIVPLFIVVIIFIFAEAGFLQVTGRQKIDWHDIVFNINSGHIMLWLFRCLEVLCYQQVLIYFNLGLFDNIHPFWLWLVTLLAWDFGYYWLHRFHHQFRLLWAVHIVHHQGEHYNLSLGVRNSWYSALTTIPFFILLAVSGVPLSIFLIVSAAHYSVQFLNHSALVPRLGWLEHIFVTPAHHRVHHLNERRYANTNYGGTFIFWDKLFGTFCALPAQQKYAYGVKGLTNTTNPLWENHHLFLRLAGVSQAKKKGKARYPHASAVIVAGALLLFILFLAYIQLYGYQIENPTSEQAALFILLAGGSVGLGAACDGRRWGMALWLAITLILPLLFLGYWRWNGTFWYFILPALAVHGIVLILRLRPWRGLASRETS